MMISTVSRLSTGIGALVANRAPFPVNPGQLGAFMRDETERFRDIPTWPVMSTDEVSAGSSWLFGGLGKVTLLA